MLLKSSLTNTLDITGDYGRLTEHPKNTGEIMFAILCLFASFFFATSAYCAWERFARGWWVWLIPAAVFFGLYVSQIHS